MDVKIINDKLVQLPKWWHEGPNVWYSNPPAYETVPISHIRQIGIRTDRRSDGHVSYTVGIMLKDEQCGDDVGSCRRTHHVDTLEEAIDMVIGWTAYINAQL